MTSGLFRHGSDMAIDLAPFKKLVLETCGFFFDNEREQTLAKALSRRMAAVGVDAPRKYHDLLVRNGEEFVRLTELLTVNETYFFREPGHLNLLINELIPELMDLRMQRPIHILSAGCSTGEEPYTVAMMLRERFGNACDDRFVITGVDIDPSAVAVARKGCYGKHSFRGMNPVLFERYFGQSEHGSCLIKEAIQKQVQFEVMNLLDARHLERMQKPDIILYRNVSIYFPQHVQREIFARLASILVDYGCLLVGASETIHHDTGVLTLTSRGPLFFFQKYPRVVVQDRRISSRHLVAAGTKNDSPQALFSGRGTADRAAGHAHQEHIRRVGPQNAVYVDVRESFDAAVNMAGKGGHEQALAVLETLLNQDASFIKAITLKASLLLTLSRFDEAESASKAALEVDPLCLEAHLMLGMIARQKGDEDGAVRRFRDAMFLDASCWPAHFFSADILYSRKELKRAKAGFETALRILESSPQESRGQRFFPLAFNGEQFIVICRHKLSLLKESP